MAADERRSPDAAKVLVCGSRMFALDGGGSKIVWNRLDALYEAAESPDFHLVTGGANGPDEWAREWAVHSGVDHTVLYAQWDDYGKRAGIIRNIAMLNLNPALVVAFWDGESKGTKHTMDEAEKRGIPVEVVRG